MPSFHCHVSGSPFTGIKSAGPRDRQPGTVSSIYARSCVEGESCAADEAGKKDAGKLKTLMTLATNNVPTMSRKMAISRFTFFDRREVTGELKFNKRMLKCQSVGGCRKMITNRCRVSLTNSPIKRAYHRIAENFTAG